jgi:hypothetical protein
MTDPVRDLKIEAEGAANLWRLIEHCRKEFDWIERSLNRGDLRDAMDRFQGLVRMLKGINT